MSEWQPIETAPRDGSEVLLYRPLAYKTHDPIVTIRKSTHFPQHRWPATVPEGCAIDGPGAYTEGACYATHWMPLPAAPTKD